MKHNNTLIEAILITYRSLTRKLPFKSAHLISIGDVYLLTVNALMRTHVQLGAHYPWCFANRCPTSSGQGRWIAVMFWQHVSRDIQSQRSMRMAFVIIMILFYVKDYRLLYGSISLSSEKIYTWHAVKVFANVHQLMFLVLKLVWIRIEYSLV